MAIFAGVDGVVQYCNARSGCSGILSAHAGIIIRLGHTRPA